MDLPEVSVAMAVYNGADHLPKTLDSVLCQHGVAFEMVVVDDGSDDASAAIRKLDPLFQVTAEDGYVLFRNWRNMLGEWASDDALRVFDLTRECAMGIPEINGAAIGLNMKNGLALEFLDQWYAAARNGVAFRGIEEPLRTDEDYASVKWNRSNLMHVLHRLMPRRG